jgi:hypothetical protein
VRYVRIIVSAYFIKTSDELKIVYHIDSRVPLLSVHLIA